MTDDLVKRLRKEDPECGLRHSIAMEAADRIEALEAEMKFVMEINERLLAALREIATSQRSDSEQAFVFKMLARAALAEEKKE